MTNIDDDIVVSIIKDFFKAEDELRVVMTEQVRSQTLNPELQQYQTNSETSLQFVAEVVKSEQDSSIANRARDFFHAYTQYGAYLHEEAKNKYEEAQGKRKPDREKRRALALRARRAESRLRRAL